MLENRKNQMNRNPLLETLENQRYFASKGPADSGRSRNAVKHQQQERSEMKQNHHQVCPALLASTKLRKIGWFTAISALFLAAVIQPAIAGSFSYTGAMNAVRRIHTAT